MTGFFNYTCYGLALRSRIELPELQPLPTSSAHANRPDINIRLGAVAAKGLGGGEQLGPYAWADSRSLWLRVPAVARFLVSEGRDILIDPEPGIDEDSLRVFLLGSAFGALLFQRGYLVLHGNAIRIGDQCLVCVGPSGAGKSTLAAGFLRRGYPVLADDVAPVDGECRALPGFPRIKLWRDVTHELAIDTSGLRRIRPNTEKFNLPVGSAETSAPLPIRWVYILGSDLVEGVQIEPINGVDRFQPLYHNTYRVGFLNGMALKTEHLSLCGKLAGQIRLARLTRPRSGFHLEPLIDAILADIASHP